VGGDLRDDVLGLVRTAGRVSAFVVTPFDARERTTQRGWGRGDDQAHLRAAVRRLRPGTAVSVFCDPDPEGIELAAAAGATSVELNCRGFVESFGGQGQAVEIARLRAAAERARALGLAVNAAHDLGVRQLRTLTDEVSRWGTASSPTHSWPALWRCCRTICRPASRAPRAAAPRQ
jgi:pyridoxine 5-phosphate synthase